MAEATKRESYLSGYHYAEIIATTETGATLAIPVLLAGKVITCTLIAGAGSGKFQITTSSDAVVKAGTATVWQYWAKVSRTGTVSDVLTGPVTAIRGVSVSGEIKIEVVL